MIRILGGLLGSAGALLVVACAGDPSDRAADRGEGSWAVERHERAGTEFVRNLGASDAPISMHEELRIGSLEGPPHEAFGSIDGVRAAPDGSFAVLDARSFQVHRYDAEGRHLGSFGSRGEGPGEFTAPNGLARLPAGGYLVVDGRPVARLHRFTDEGTLLGSEALPLNAMGAPVVERAGAVLVPFRLPPAPGGQAATEAWHRIPPDGAGADTLRLPELALNPAWTIHVVDETMRRGFHATVPFTPRAMAVRHPDGGWVAGTGERYEIFRITDQGDTLQVIEREAERALVDPAEADDARERILAQARNVDPEWRWTAPEVPGEKPFFRSIVMGQDGSLGVWRHTAGEPAELPAEVANLPPGQGPPRWVQPPVLDLFAPDGCFMGTLALPVGTGLMAFSLERAFLRERDALDVEQLVRVRLEPAITCPD